MCTEYKKDTFEIIAFTALIGKLTVYCVSNKESRVDLN